MAYYEEDSSICRYHPNRNPCPGICPSCLRERLKTLAMTTTTNTTNIYSLSQSPISYDYSSVSSGRISPRRRRHQRVASDIMGSIYFAIGGSHDQGLKKSRSVIFAPRKGVMKDHVVHSKKKTGFWSKLLHRSSGKKLKV